MLGWALRTVFLVAVIGVMGAIIADQRTDIDNMARDSAVERSSPLNASMRRVVRDDSEDAADDEGWGRKLRIHADSRGHYMVEARVNGVTIPFLVDTGASMVVLSRADARRIGYGPNELDYSMRARTANGVVKMAPVTLRQVRLNRLRVNNVDATVNEGPMSVSLLGMSFLGRLRGYEVENEVMTLRW